MVEELAITLPKGKSADVKCLIFQEGLHRGPFEKQKEEVVTSIMFSTFIGIVGVVIISATTFFVLDVAERVRDNTNGSR